MIQFVSGATANTSTTVATLSKSYTPNVGSLIFTVLGASNTISAPSCADNNSNALTVVTIDSGLYYAAYGISKTGATSYTWNWTTNRQATMALAEYRGAIGTLGTPVTATNTNTTPSVGVSGTALGSWVIAGFGAKTALSAGTAGNFRETGSNGAPVDVAINDNNVMSIVAPTNNAIGSANILWFAWAAEFFAATVPSFSSIF